MTDKYDDIDEFPENLPDTFEILEEGIGLQTQMEYLEYSHSFDYGKLTERETINLGKILLDKSTSIEVKKKALTILAHLGTISSFRQIEKYYEQPDKELKGWSELALHECKMILESSLTDQTPGFISTGLGGYQDKLRYYFMVLPSSDSPFSTTQGNIIKGEFDLLAKELNCIVETFDLSDTFVGLTVLVPMDVAVGTFVDSGIKRCNEFGDFVFEYYYATNMEIPDESEIQDIIKKVRE